MRSVFQQTLNRLAQSCARSSLISREGQWISHNGVGCFHSSQWKGIGIRNDHRGYAQVCNGHEALKKRPSLDSVTEVVNSIPQIRFDNSKDSVRACTIISNDSTNKLKHLISYLQSLSCVLPIEHNLIVFLATPNFAQEILSSSESSIADALDIILVGRSITNIQILFAIVDKLPSFQNTSLGHINDEDNDGISVAITSKQHLELSDVGKDNWSSNSNRFSHSLSADAPSTITIAFHPEPQEIFDAHMNASQNQNLVASSHYLQIPLASTLFQNGMRYTLLHREYSYNKEQRSWKVINQQAYRHANFTLPFSPGSRDNKNSSLDLPLLQLTSIQKVHACMGNIIRSLQIIDQAPSEKRIDIRPASEQLENAVDQYFRDKKISPHAVSIWALIIPSHLHSTVTQHKKSFDLSAEPNNNLTDLFNQGARLCKVTSGGGGWGTKAGLLSLDPDVSFTVSHEYETMERDNDNETLNDKLGQVVIGGDYIQFFIWPYDLQFDPSIPRTWDGEKARLDTSLCGPQNNDKAILEIGVIPSSIDKDYTVQTVKGGKHDQVIVLKNHLGALSERGMSLKVRNMTLNYDDFRIEVREHETKIDVPFAKYSSQGNGSRQSETKAATYVEA